MTLEDLIRQEIESRGPMRFDRYMELALYHPLLGYYMTEDRRIGWSGDFVTAPELDPAYGELWATAFEEIWDACERPKPWNVIEMGPGEGAFAAAMMRSLRREIAESVVLHLVEPSPVATQRQRAALGSLAGVHWYSHVAEIPKFEAGCLFANEVIDNQPVRLVEQRADGPHEILVGLDGTVFEFIIEPVASPNLRNFFDGLGFRPAEGNRAEVPVGAIELLARAADKIGRGALVIVDYGDTPPHLYDRQAGTLLCYSASGVDDRPLDAPGTKDITVHANWGAVRGVLEDAGFEVTGPIPQAEVLRSLGLADIAAAAKERSHTGTAVERVRALSRRGALASLADPGGLGGLGVVVGTTGCEIPPFTSRTGPEGPVR